MQRRVERDFTRKMKKALREANTARAGCSKVRTPPARPLSQTHRQDRLQYTAPQLASAQCNDLHCAEINYANTEESDRNIIIIVIVNIITKTSNLQIEQHLDSIPTFFLFTLLSLYVVAS